jgi:SMC interacting uncharacterized protein involved in chromosome segregation
MSLHFFLLFKIQAELPAAGKLSESNKLLLWLSLFKAETAEELERIKTLEVPEMNEAINAYNQITVSPEFRELERARSYARHNEASALGHARREGEAKGMAKERKKWQGVVKGMKQEREKWQGMAKGMEQEREKWQAEIARLRAELDRK